MPMQDRYLSIHCHFYQPPRENPWLEAVERQDGAFPYHDWNGRITAECYAPNSASRVLDSEGRITEIVNNYELVSFNFGPTLLAWLKQHSPWTYRSIVEADKKSRQNRSGHGNALAQPYSHMIMPLAGARDKKTQVLWGIRDFTLHFDRSPEGMWLPETAADTESLEAMARAGIRFTILSPHQAAASRKLGAREWHEHPRTPVDTTRPHLVRLPSGRGITVFFYNSDIAKAVAFENALQSGEGLAELFMGGFSNNAHGAQLVCTATDGESYGHHHKFGEMALSYGLSHIERGGLARVTNFGEFLALHPPELEAKLAENTSWSCEHGVERWRSDCGCSTGGEPGWTQQWRAPLRESLDILRGELDDVFEQRSAGVLRDPWASRDAYIDVVLDRSEESVQRFMQVHAAKDATLDEALTLLEMQRHAMLMYTSCGWFFNDLTGIETIQVLRYAARAAELARRLGAPLIEKRFIRALGSARSNVPGRGNGADIYAKDVLHSAVDLKRVASHYALSSLYEDYPETTSIYCYDIKRKDYAHKKVTQPPYESPHEEGTCPPGSAEMAAGRALVTNTVTRSAKSFSFAVLRTEAHDFTTGVYELGDAEYSEFRAALLAAFKDGDYPAALRIIQRTPGSIYSLRDLLRDERLKILGLLAASAVAGFEADNRAMYEGNRELMAFLKKTGMEPPEAFIQAARFTLLSKLKRELRDGRSGGLASILGELRGWGLGADGAEMEIILRRRLEREAGLFSKAPAAEGVETMISLLEFARDAEVPLNLWMIQNSYFDTAGKGYGADALRRSERFHRLGEMLSFNMQEIL